MILEPETLRIARQYHEEHARNFERDLRSALAAAELATGTSFNKLRRLVDSIGGHPAAQKLLEEPQSFSYGLRRLRDAGASRTLKPEPQQLQSKKLMGQ